MWNLALPTLRRIWPGSTRTVLTKHLESLVSAVEAQPVALRAIVLQTRRHPMQVVTILVILTITIALLTAGACASSTDAPPPADEVAAAPPEPAATPEPMPTAEPTAPPTPEPMPTAEPTAPPTPEPMPTADPTASPTPEPELSLDPGTHKVGTDIEPGVYAGKAGIGVSDWCSWKRLSGVTGDSDDVIAIEIEQGQFYVEILPTDKYFNVACEITPLADWPIPDEHPTKIEQGTYLIGRDISPGTYAGKAGIGVSDWCSWKRLSGVTGDSDDVIAIEIEQGQFYATIEATDYAFTTACELTLSE